MRTVVEVIAIVVGAAVMLRALPRRARRQAKKTEDDHPRRPIDLERMERLMVTGRSTAADVHLRLRPVLREIALARLLRVGIRMDGEPDRARELLGEPLWEIVRPERPRPADLRGPGLALEQLEMIVDRLERV